MKLKKILSFVLVLTLLLGLYPLVARGEGEAEEKTGLTLNKTATYNEATNDFTITLEAYATGSKVVSHAGGDKPTDIVLVLDQSGSMGCCINCGAKYNSGKWDSNDCYSEAGKAGELSYDSETTYYYKTTTQGGGLGGGGQSTTTYSQAVYCDGSGQIHNGHSGWYKQGGYGSTHSRERLGDNTALYVLNDAHEHRLDSLKTALNSFYTSVAGKATQTANHRIAVVGFSSKEDTYHNTELLTGVTLTSGSPSESPLGTAYYYPQTKNTYGNYSEVNGKSYGSISTNDYASALQDMSTEAGKTSVRKAINALTAQGGTKTDDGLTMAENIFKNNPVTNGSDGKPLRNRIVILFTDGETNSDKGTTIQTAWALKNTYGATVYTVGIFDGANGTPVTGNSWDSTEEENIFMHLISSNFKNADTWYPQPSNNTYPSGNSSYYLSASGADALNNIFEQIAGNINTESTVTELDEETVIKDVVTQQFTMPENATAIKVYTQESNGSVNSWKTREEFTDANVTIDSANRSISVTNFSFKDNWVGEETTAGTTTFHNGKKLIIEFKVKAQDVFLGGNDVFTNTSAGVYKDANATTPEFTFNRPQVNVPIKSVTVTATDKNVYLLGSLTADQIKAGATATCGNVTIDLNQPDNNYGLESWQTEYVNITVSYTDKDGNTVTDLTNLTDDNSYTVAVTITPKEKNPKSEEGTKATEQKGSGKGNIYVFKPELTFKDSEVWYGDTAPESYNTNLTNTVWKHGETNSDDVSMIGDKPTLDLTYAPDSTKISGGKINSKDDIPVDVTVKIGSTDVTEKTSFKHTDCANKTCTVPEGKEFLLHVKTCTLTITKAAGEKTNIGNDEYFVFTVSKDGVKYTQVTIKGTGSVIIKELPVGNYTVTEDAGVAWRYTSSMSPDNVTLSSTNNSATVTCTNTLKDGKWLNDFTRAINTHGSQTPTIDGNTDGE